jgi:hypothetical protein
LRRVAKAAAPARFGRNDKYRDWATILELIAGERKTRTL